MMGADDYHVSVEAGKKDTAEAKLLQIKRILAEPAPFGAVEEQLDQIREIVSGKQIKGGN